MPPTASSEVGESSQRDAYRNESTRPLSSSGGATATPTQERVKSFVNGIVSPFTACWQPIDSSCAPGCVSDRVFRKQPSVVSPHLDRVISYRDSRAEHEQDDHSLYSSHHRPPNGYHRPRPHVSKASPLVSPSGSFSSRREPADEAEVTTTPYDPKKRSTDIAKPRSNDILCGRGGSSNRHLGNIHFRELVAANKQIYVGLTKKQKMLVARKIVDAIHNAGGRFLAKDLDTGLFYDIGLPRSLEKTSQGKYIYIQYSIYRSEELCVAKLFPLVLLPVQ